LGVRAYFNYITTGYFNVPVLEYVPPILAFWPNFVVRIAERRAKMLPPTNIIMHKNAFWPGFRPNPCWGADRAFAKSLAGLRSLLLREGKVGCTSRG